MRVHFDVTHPAHVHLFRPAIQTLTDDGHAVAVTSRDKEVTTELLDAYGIDHCVLSTKRSSQLALAPEWALRTQRTLRFVREFEPDVVVSQFNPSAIGASTLSDAASVVFHDSETAGGLAKALGPLADSVHSPVGVTHDLGDDHESYEGFHELAYLHPERFEPDPSVLERYGVDPEESYAVLRTVSMGAYHDVGADGLSGAETRRLASELAEHGDVYVSSEGEPPADIPAEPVPVPPEDIHHLLAGASVFVGDSDTMAIEAGILGTPSVRLDCFGEGTLGCFDELERYDLVDSRADSVAAVDRALELADDPEAGERWEQRRRDLLADKIDVTAYMLERIRDAAGVSGAERSDEAAERRVPVAAGLGGASGVGESETGSGQTGASKKGSGRSGTSENGSGRSGTSENRSGRSGTNENGSGRRGASADGSGRSDANTDGSGRTDSQERESSEESTEGATS